MAVEPELGPDGKPLNPRWIDKETGLIRVDRGDGRDEKGRLLPGVSANPSGKPKQRDQMRLIRKETRDGVELVRGVLGIFRKHRGSDKAANVKVALEAATFLWDRGFGKPPQSHLVARANVGESNLMEMLDAMEPSELERFIEATIVEVDGQRPSQDDDQWEDLPPEAGWGPDGPVPDDTEETDDA